MVYATDTIVRLVSGPIFNRTLAKSDVRERCWDFLCMVMVRGHSGSGVRGGGSRGAGGSVSGGTCPSHGLDRIVALCPSRTCSAEEAAPRVLIVRDALAPCFSTACLLARDEAGDFARRLDLGMVNGRCELGG